MWGWDVGNVLGLRLGFLDIKSVRAFGRDVAVGLVGVGRVGSQRCGGGKG